MRCALGAEREAHLAVDVLRNLASQRGQGVWEASREAWAFHEYRSLLESAPEDVKSVVRARKGALEISELFDQVRDRLRAGPAHDCDPDAELDSLGWMLTVENLLRRVDLGSTPPWVVERLDIDESPHIVNDASINYLTLHEEVGLPKLTSRPMLSLRAASGLAPTQARGSSRTLVQVRECLRCEGRLVRRSRRLAFLGGSDLEWPARRLFDLLEAVSRGARVKNRRAPDRRYVSDRAEFVIALYLMLGESGTTS